MYTEKVLDHFKNPRNVGMMDDADGVGEVGNPVCGDMMTFYIKVKDNPASARAPRARYPVPTSGHRLD